VDIKTDSLKALLGDELSIIMNSIPILSSCINTLT
jgi:hypothetical protein